ncbi:ABC transporter permease [Oceanirhabdus sp. W0125-5]|uniref:ABC transporter permease n=1 Tax=Oceanirhabdus sp. W0125-5 TaxID=2999116 RepID=UPI0022F2C03D|nr:ABC transporter permease [Oceanirhabdus sp. W0125-5]WBW97194.1 ABC transporter permease [Oceanirhabdus sp. W0125-5]
MFNLINLELKRFNIKNKIMIAVICNLCIVGVVSLIFFSGIAELGRNIETYIILNQLRITVPCIIFIIYASVLIAELIISQYKDKTITLLFTYPISRKKILISKLIIIFIFTFLNIIISSIFLSSSFYIIQIFTKTMVVQVTSNMIYKHLISVMVAAVTNSFIAMIPIYFGMRKKSIVATIISGVLISVFLYSNNNNGFSISSIIIVPITMMFIGIFVVYVTLKNIDNKDVIV